MLSTQRAGAARMQPRRVRALALGAARDPARISRALLALRGEGAVELPERGGAPETRRATRYRRAGRVEERETGKDVGSPGCSDNHGWPRCDSRRCSGPAERRY